MLLLDIVILLTACLLAGAVMSWLKQSPIVGYLLAGMILGGPGSIDAIRSPGQIEHISELGVAFLLFSLGLEFSWPRLMSLGHGPLRTGMAQVIVTLFVTAGAAACFGLSVPQALAIGAMVSLSSTATVVRVMADRSELDGQHGRDSLAILLVQDMAVVPLAILLVVLDGEGSFADVAQHTLKIVLLAVGFVGVLYMTMSMSTQRFLPRLSIGRNRDFISLFAVIVSIGAAIGAESVGLSPALGAFLAGMFLGSSPFATLIRADLSALKAILITLFFGSVGMVADASWIIAHWWQVLGLALGLLSLKTVVVWLLLRFIGRGNGSALAAGLCIAQVGEFAFVLGAQATASKIIDHDLSMLIVSTSIATLFLTPAMIAAAPQVARWIERRFPSKVVPLSTREAATDHSTDAPTAIVIGFGPAGQAAARALLAQRSSVCVVDLNRESLRIAESLGFRVHIGDATTAEVLEHAGAAKALVAVVTLPDHMTARAVISHLRVIAPRIHILVRCRYQRFMEDMVRAGANDVVGDEQEAGEELARHLEHWRERLQGAAELPAP